MKRAAWTIWNRIPQRLVTLYLPLGVFVFVLLFPFYWMTITAFKSNEELLNFRDFNPLWVANPTLANVKKLFFDTHYPLWLWNTMLIAVAATFLSLFCAVCAAYAIERIRYSGARFIGMAIFLAYLVPPSILFIPLATTGLQIRAVQFAVRADPDLSDLPDPVLHLAADGLLPLHPLRA